MAKSDTLLEAIFHESAHAHLQNFTHYQQTMLAKDKLPLEQYASEPNKDSYELMALNYSFYVHTAYKDTYVASVNQNVNINKDRYNNELNKYYRSYKKQPMERYSCISRHQQ